MKIYRAATNTKERSPKREVFGRIGEDILIGSLDLCTMKKSGGRQQSAPGEFIDTPVKLANEIGTIKPGYKLPTFGECVPAIAIQAKDNFINNMQKIPDIITEQIVGNPAINQEVELEIFQGETLIRLPINGEIIDNSHELKKYSPYFTTARVKAFVVKFNVNRKLTGRIGARVVASDGSGVIGMLVNREPNKALVYPASEIKNLV